MKNIRTISRGNNAVALQFTAKKSSSEITYINGEFNIGAPLSIPDGPLSATLHHSEVIDLASIAAGVTLDTVVTFTGITTAWNISSSTLAALEAGLVYNAYISDVDEVTLSVTNVTAAPIDAASNTWKFTATKI